MSGTIAAWAQATGDQLFAFVTSGSRGWAQHYSAAGPSFIRVGNLDHGSIALDLRDVQHVSPPVGAEGERTRLEADDLLISITADVGMVGVVPADLGEAYINQHIALARPREGVNARYVAWYLASEADGKRRLRDVSRGGTKAGLGLDDIRQVPIPFPPAKEQQRIADKLDTVLARVDACRERLDRVTPLLKRFRQSVLAAATSGRLTESWRGASIEEDELPASWVVQKLETYAVNRNNARIPIAEALRKDRQGPYPYYGASGPIDTIDGYTHDGEFLLIGEDGANLLSRSKAVAFVARGKIWVNNHAHVLSCADSASLSYLGYVINGMDLSPYVTGSAQPKLTKKNLDSLLVPTPPSGEKAEIVRRVETLFAFADRLEARLAQAQTAVERLTPALLAKAFRGELVPQDPADEPASELLRRLADQRAAEPPRRGRRSAKFVAA